MSIQHYTELCISQLFIIRLFSDCQICSISGQALGVLLGQSSLHQRKGQKSFRTPGKINLDRRTKDSKDSKDAVICFDYLWFTTCEVCRIMSDIFWYFFDILVFLALSRAFSMFSRARQCVALQGLCLRSLQRWLCLSWPRLKDSSRDQRATKLSLSLCNGNKREPMEPFLSIQLFLFISFRFFGRTGWPGQRSWKIWKARTSDPCTAVRASVSLPDLSDLCHYWTWWNGKESCSDDQRPRIDMVW